VYPALAVLHALQTDLLADDKSAATEAEGSLTVLWVGSMGGMEEELVSRAEIDYDAISAAGVHGVGLRALPGNLLRLARGHRQAQGILRRFQPDVLFFTGGFLAVPMALAGRKIPSVLYVPDIEPGLALKTLARFASRIAVTTEASGAYFPRRADIQVTGYPVREDLKAWEDGKARQALGLVADLPVLLVFGGSKGARSINRALLACLPDLLAEMQVVHITGNLDWPEVQAAWSEIVSTAEPSVLSADRMSRYRAFPYLHEEMGAALTVADLVLSRAGASTLGEFPLFGLPAVLVPYPHAWRYQRVNAEYLEQQGAALMIKDDELPGQLLPVVLGLMRVPSRRAQMRQAMRSLAHPAAAQSIARMVCDLASTQRQEGLTS
jgi:UDP-N-acetylglucosamine--N-acetylmuramyl-(pentapeptide) pyrophosphoryl-undecaprenol N-acetylglucosamine transferase